MNGPSLQPCSTGTRLLILCTAGNLIMVVPLVSSVAVITYVTPCRYLRVLGSELNIKDRKCRLASVLRSIPMLVQPVAR